MKDPFLAFIETFEKRAGTSPEYVGECLGYHARQLRRLDNKSSTTVVKRVIQRAKDYWLDLTGEKIA